MQLTAFAAQREIRYLLLSDPGSVTIDAFGLRDAQYKPCSFAYSAPQLATFVVSPRGVIMAKLAEEAFKVRPSVQAVLAAVDQLAG